MRADMSHHLFDLVDGESWIESRVCDMAHFWCLIRVHVTWLITFICVIWLITSLLFKHVMRLMNICKSCRIYWWVTSHISAESCRMHWWVTSHIYASHVAYIDESRHRVMPHILMMSHVTHICESCHIYWWVTSHTHTCESCRIYWWVASHWVTRASCATWLITILTRDMTHHLLDFVGRERWIEAVGSLETQYLLTGPILSKKQPSILPKKPCIARETHTQHLPIVTILSKQRALYSTNSALNSMKNSLWYFHKSSYDGIWSIFWI